MTHVMTIVLVLHLVGALLAPWAVRAWGRIAFVALAAVPAASMVWLLVGWFGRADGSATGGTGESLTERLDWVPTLGLTLTLRLDPLSLLMAVLVTGVGAGVLVYCGWSFVPREIDTARFAATLMAFAASMLGLVLADDLILLFVFWELTTICSYLLIGHQAHLRAARRAALQALIVTTAGGLAMLVGLVILGRLSGSSLLSDVLASPPRGTAATVAVGLVLLGALSKSAIAPFHFWLPPAMAAPTPVSAYLHAAAMVKGGIYLVARMAPAFAGVPIWRPVIITLGLVTLLLGGLRALRQVDLKLLLAHGTVSQLGLLVVLVGLGWAPAALAGVMLLLAHALFKSALFLAVGVLERAVGTRDLRELSGLARRMPVLTGVGVLAALSMAGLPPMAGFVAKEAAYSALLYGAPPGRVVSIAVLITIVLGSALTVAYSARFVFGAFGSIPGAPPTLIRQRPAPMLLAVPLVLGAAGPVVGIASSMVGGLLGRYAATLPPGTVEPPLALWHGFGTPLALSATSIAVGSVLVLGRTRVEAWQRRLPRLGDAALAYRRLMRRVNRLAVAVTASTQRGSLPVYLGTILVVLLVLPGSVLLLGGVWPTDLRVADSPAQLGVAALIAVVAVAATRARQRLTAVLLVGASGYGVGMLFALHGAPDLALTQLLVETLVLVAFVLVLRRLPKTIRQRNTARQRRWRLVLVVPLGMVVAWLGAAALAARRAPAISDAFAQAAFTGGGGRNVVNVTLVDIRAWDTFGEISVLVAAATGVASMVFLRSRTGAPPRATAQDPAHAPAARGPVDTWLRAGQLVPAANRSVILEVVTRMVFHTVIVVSVFLVFAGHNTPGGGFAGGLVAGLALVIRYLAGGRYELGEAAPVDAGLLLGLGLLLAGGSGVAGLVLGGDVLQTAIVELTLPVFGHVKLVTSLFFDIGVYLIVTGLVLDILRSLGAELDRRQQTELRVSRPEAEVRPVGSRR